MKSLHLEVYRSLELKASYKYYVLFTRGQRLNFKSKRKASDFIARFKSSCNDTIRNVFDLNTELYKIYYDYYFELSPFDANILKREFDSFLDRSSLLFVERSSGNNTITINCVWSLLNVLEDILLKFQKYAKEKNNYHLVNRVNARLKLFGIMNNSFYDLMQTIEVDKTYKIKQLRVSYKSPTLSMTC